MKKINIKTIIIILLSITTISMAIGFIVLSMKIDKLSHKEETFDVVITKIKDNGTVKGGIKSPTSTDSINSKGNNANINFNLYSPGDEINLSVVIKNKGTLKAEIIDLIGVPDYINDSTSKSKISPVEITSTDISGKTLSPNEETEVKISVIYDRDKESKTFQIPYQLYLLTKSSK